MLIISDFILSIVLVLSDMTINLRTKMDRDRGVVDDTALLYMENAFPLKDMPYEWNGRIEFILLTMRLLALSILRSWLVLNGLLLLALKNLSDLER